MANQSVLINKNNQTGFKGEFNRTEVLILSVLVIFTVLTRFLPHIPNFSPVLGMALFCGASTKNRKLAFLLPLIALFVSDWALGFYGGIGFVYLSYVIAISLGMMMSKIRVVNVLVSAMAVSLVFFVLSNLGVWLFSGLYAPNSAGLVQCYIMALPFFHYTYLGTIVGAGVLFAAKALLLKGHSVFKENLFKA